MTDNDTDSVSTIGADQEQSRRAVLVYRSADQQPDSPPQIIKLKMYNTIIGRDRADIIIADERASSPHCQLQQVGGDFQVFDMNSGEGTFVNGRAIMGGTPLKHGDIVTVGSTEFEFRWVDQQDIAELTSSQKTIISPSQGS